MFCIVFYTVMYISTFLHVLYSTCTYMYVQYLLSCPRMLDDLLDCALARAVGAIATSDEPTFVQRAELSIAAKRQRLEELQRLAGEQEEAWARVMAEIAEGPPPQAEESEESTGDSGEEEGEAVDDEGADEKEACDELHRVLSQPLWRL